MKKPLLILGAICSLFTVKAQNIFPQNGNVGIGTLTPNSTLEIKSTKPQIVLNSLGMQAPFGMFHQPGIVFKTTNSKAKIVFEDGFALGSHLAIKNNQATMGVWGNQVLIGTTPSTGLEYGQKVTQAKTWMTRLAIGGKFSTGYNLSVRGKSIFEEVHVQLMKDWPDYVFKDSYQLRSLEEVNDFINENSHLPDVPSAEEVSSSGINVAEMNAILLRKIEELTIYNIELNNRLKKIESRN